MAGSGLRKRTVSDKGISAGLGRACHLASTIAGPSRRRSVLLTGRRSALGLRNTVLQCCYGSLMTVYSKMDVERPDSTKQLDAGRLVRYLRY